MLLGKLVNLLLNHCWDYPDRNWGTYVSKPFTVSKIVFLEIKG